MFIAAEIVARYIRKALPRLEADRILHLIAVEEHERRINRVDENLNRDYAIAVQAVHELDTNRKATRNARLKDQIHAIDEIRHLFGI